MTESSATPARRIVGICTLLVCALLIDPARVVGTATQLSELSAPIVLHALVLPMLAACGLWLVLPNPTVLALCAGMLALVHSRWGSPDLFNGYLYPLTVVVATAAFIWGLFRDDVEQ